MLTRELYKLIDIVDEHVVHGKITTRKFVPFTRSYGTTFLRNEQNFPDEDNTYLYYWSLLNSHNALGVT